MSSYSYSPYYAQPYPPPSSSASASASGRYSPYSSLYNPTPAGPPPPPPSSSSSSSTHPPQRSPSASSFGSQHHDRPSSAASVSSSSSANNNPYLRVLPPSQPVPVPIPISAAGRSTSLSPPMYSGRPQTWWSDGRDRGDRRASGSLPDVLHGGRLAHKKPLTDFDSSATLLDQDFKHSIHDTIIRDDAHDAKSHKRHPTQEFRQEPEEDKEVDRAFDYETRHHSRHSSAPSQYVDDDPMHSRSTTPTQRTFMQRAPSGPQAPLSPPQSPTGTLSNMAGTIPTDPSITTTTNNNNNDNSGIHLVSFSAATFILINILPIFSSWSRGLRAHLGVYPGLVLTIAASVAGGALLRSQRFNIARIYANMRAHPASRELFALLATLGFGYLCAGLAPLMFRALHTFADRIPVVGALAVYLALVSWTLVLGLTAVCTLGFLSWDVTKVVHVAVVKVTRYIINPDGDVGESRPPSPTSLRPVPHFHVVNGADFDRDADPEDDDQAFEAALAAAAVAAAAATTTTTITTTTTTTAAAAAMVNTKDGRMMMAAHETTASSMFSVAKGKMPLYRDHNHHYNHHHPTTLGGVPLPAESLDDYQRHAPSNFRITS